MVFADQLDLRDPQMISEFAYDIYCNMRQTEKQYTVAPNYLQKV